MARAPPTKLADASTVAATVEKRSGGAQCMASNTMLVTAPANPAPIRKRATARPAKPSAAANKSVPSSATRAMAETVRLVPKRSEGEPRRQLHHRRGEHHGADHETDLGRAQTECLVELDRDHAAGRTMQLGDHQERPGDGQDPQHGTEPNRAPTGRRPSGMAAPRPGGSTATGLRGLPPARPSARRCRPRPESGG